jgi:agmatine deiminase
MRIADAVARFEPVVMLVNPDAMVLAEGLRSRAVYKNHIRLVSAALDDLWLRDTGPVFVRAPDSGRLSAMDFNFNGWGNKQPHARDTQVAGWIADWAGVPKIRSRLVLEGGGLEVDGEGTAIIKESCVLNPNRNAGLDRAVVEQELRNRLGLTKVIWLPGPAGGDITDAHTDFYARFAGAGRVVVSHDEHDTYEERAVTQHHIDVLARATDAKGRPLSLTVIPVPVNPASSKANQDTFAAGYINYYLCNAGLIMPAFGDATADRGARQALQALHPDRHVVQMRIDAIAAGGGGIHCTTQQQPKV